MAVGANPSRHEDPRGRNFLQYISIAGLGMVLSGCLAKPLLNGTSMSPPVLHDPGLLIPNAGTRYTDNKPIYTCIKNGVPGLPEGCKAGEVGAPEYFESGKLAERFIDEKVLGPQGSPTYGLALAGGGQKAASYAIGVLSAIYQNSDPSLQPDAVSSVSGGSYAALWLMSRVIDAYEQGREEDQLNQFRFGAYFDDCLPVAYERFAENADIGGRVPCDRNPATIVERDGVLTDSLRFQNQLRGFSDLFDKGFDYPIPATGNAELPTAKTEYEGKKRSSEKSSSIPQAQSSRTKAGWEISKELFYNSLTLPAHWPLRVLFDARNLNVSVSARRYFRNIERTYALPPANCETLEKLQLRGNGDVCLIEDSSGTIELRRQGRPPSTRHADAGRTMETLGFLHAFQHGIRSTLCPNTAESIPCAKALPKVPLWIANTSAWVEPIGVADRNMPDLEDAVFEFTPYRFGSRHFGYWEGTPRRIDLAMIAGASGAFLDSQQRVTSPRLRPFLMVGMHLANLNWGIELPNPRYQDSTRLVHSLLPFPLYLGHRREANNTGAWIRLGDGGISENLGAWSLIRRGYTNIIISDHAQDSKGRFEDICRLRDHLQRKRLHLFMPSLGEFGDHCDRVLGDDSGYREIGYNLWDEPLTVLRGCVTWDSSDVNCDEPRKGNPGNYFATLHVLKPALPGILLQVLANRHWSPAEKTKRVQEMLPGFPPEVVAYVDANYGNCQGDCANEPLVFPQDSTVGMTLDSSPYKFGAYRELARWQASHLLQQFGTRARPRRLPILMPCSWRPGHGNACIDHRKE